MDLVQTAAVAITLTGALAGLIKALTAAAREARAWRRQRRE